jgi:transcription antitermination factor NusG
MLPEGQRVEVVAGAFVRLTGVVVSRQEIMVRNLQRVDDVPPAENEALVLITLWGREVVVSLTTDDVQAI